MALSNTGLMGLAGAMLRPGGGLGDGFLAYNQGAQQDVQMQATNMYRQAQAQQMRSVDEERQMKIQAAKQQQESRRALAELMGRKPPAPQGCREVGGSVVPEEILAFLRGAAPLEGVWFGEKHPTRRGMFWWRKLLPGA
jgi:hypothetical protein